MLRSRELAVHRRSSVTCCSADAAILLECPTVLAAGHCQCRGFAVADPAQCMVQPGIGTFGVAAESFWALRWHHFDVLGTGRGGHTRPRCTGSLTP